MKEVSKLLELRKQRKKKKPLFIREGSQSRKRIGRKWRKPRGLHSKMRHKFAGHRKKVNKGYLSPALVKGLDNEGLKLILVEKISDLEKLNSKVCKIIIKSAVGDKKRILLLEKCAEKGIKVYGVKDSAKKIGDLKSKKKLKKEQKIKKKETKKETKEKVKKKAELEKKVESAEDKKKQDQKEMEKIITKRE